MQKTIAIDFDGVLHAYRRGWRDGSIYDVAVDGSVEAVTKLQDAGYHIVVFSTRADTPAGQASISNWLREQGFRAGEILVTDRKVPAIAYIDDRGVRFTNWPDIVKLWT
jgi:5'(3')-deoxyribonucleotidase